MKKDIILIKRGPFDAMKAPEGYYITQSAEDVEGRVFPHERMLLSAENISDWRVATPNEKAAFEASQEEQV